MIARFGVFVHVDQPHRSDEVGLGDRSHLLPSASGQLVLFGIGIDGEVLFDLVFRRVFGGPTVGFDDLVPHRVFDTADDQRRSRLVNQNAVGFVDKAEVHSPHYDFVARVTESAAAVAKHLGLQTILGSQKQAVAKKVEPKFLGGSIRDRGRIRLSARALVVGRLNDAD